MCKNKCQGQETASYVAGDGSIIGGDDTVFQVVSNLTMLFEAVIIRDEYRPQNWCRFVRVIVVPEMLYTRFKSNLIITVI